MTKSVVKVRTWGTSSGAGYGIKNILASEYRGENPGHASIEMRLPLNDDNTKLVETYCDSKPKIPYKVYSYIKNGVMETEYVINFSLVSGKPSNDGKTPIFLNPDYKSDTMYERYGHNTTDRHLLELSERIERKASTRIINLFPACSLTEKGRSLDFSTPEGKYILKLKEIANCEDLEQTAEFIIKRCNEIEGAGILNFNDPSNKSLFTACKRLNFNISVEECSATALRKKTSQFLHHNVTQELIRLREEKVNIQKTIEQKYEEINQIIVTLDGCIDRIDEPDFDLANQINELKISEGKKIELLSLGSLELKSALSKLKDENKKQFEEIYRTSSTFIDNQDDYLCYGKPADGEVQLPLGNGNNELHAEAMLQQMRVIADSNQEYDLYRYNCSTTALSILKAGKEGITSVVSPATIPLTIPQTVYNEAIKLREKCCEISPVKSLLNLDDFYKSNTGAKAISRESSSLYEAILNFAVDNIFPEQEDIKENAFYVFSEEDRASLLKCQDKLIPTELLRDLWGIIPDRTLPLSKDETNNVVIDHNMTMGQLTQGLCLLAQSNSEKRLGKQYEITNSNELNVFEVLKVKIVSEIERVAKRTDSKSMIKTADLMNTYINEVEKLKSNTTLSDKEKAAVLFKAIEPKLKINTGFNLHTTSYTEVMKTAVEIGIAERKDFISAFKANLFKGRQDNEKKNAVTSDIPVENSIVSPYKQSMD